LELKLRVTLTCSIVTSTNEQQPNRLAISLKSSSYTALFKDIKHSLNSINSGYVRTQNLTLSIAR